MKRRSPVVREGLDLVNPIVITRRLPSLEPPDCSRAGNPMALALNDFPDRALTGLPQHVGQHIKTTVGFAAIVI